MEIFKKRISWVRILILVGILLSINTINVFAADVTWTFADGNGTNGINKDVTKEAQNCSTAVYNNELYAIWSETNGTQPQIRVKKYNGTSWTSVDGGGADGINKDKAKDAQSPSLIVYNGELYAAWQECTAMWQIKVAKYTGNNNWTFVDGDASTGINAQVGGNSRDPRMAVYNDKLYVIWDEMLSNNQIRIKRYDDNGLWTSVGGTQTSGLNKDATRSAQKATLAVYGDALYAAWNETSATGTQIRVKKYNGTTWTFVDGDGSIGLNKNSTNWAFTPKMAVYNNELYVSWQENTIRIKKYDGTTWTFVDGDATAGLGEGYAPVLTVYNNELYASWYDGSQQVKVKKYDEPAWNDAYGGSGLNKDFSKQAFYSQLVVYGNKLYAAWQETNGTANQIRVASMGVNAAYNVTYDGNGPTGGAVPTDSNTYEVGNSVTILENTGNLVKAGYTFKGWNTSADGNGTEYASNGTLAMGATNVTLYAQWLAQTDLLTSSSEDVTINYAENKITYPMYTKNGIDFTKVAGIKSVLAVKTGYTYGIWKNNGQISDTNMDADRVVIVSKDGAYVNQYTFVASIKYGDINGDGVVNTVDLTLLKRYLVDGANYPLTKAYGITAADINKDNIVNEADLILLRGYLVNAQNHPIASPTEFLYTLQQLPT